MDPRSSSYYSFVWLYNSFARMNQVGRAKGANLESYAYKF